MTSRGQVTIPEVNPPIAPASALNWESEARVAQRSKRDSDGSGMLVVEEAYTALGIAVDMGDGSVAVFE